MPSETQEPLTLKLRAFGRMCHVFHGLETDTSSVFSGLQVIGVDMRRNPLARFTPHFMRLSVPASCIEAFTRTPDGTSFSHDTDPAQIEEYYVWDLAQCDVRLSGLDERRGFTTEFSADEQFSFLNDLVATGNAALDGAVTADPINSAATCVVTLPSGAVRPLSPLGGRIVSYQPFDGNRAFEPRPRKSVADGAEIALSALGSSVTFEVRRRTDGVRWSVVVGRDVVARNIVTPGGKIEPSDPIVTISNTCGCTVNTTFIERDEEFAAYYELLENPPQFDERLIPIAERSILVASGCDNPSGIRIV